ncbi:MULTISPECIES: hypothetical protein [Clostridia]|uniref:hypothetical protein n=1 Tax=Oscillospiraceae TaxID=216572 RepID=UPI003AF54EA7
MSVDEKLLVKAQTIVPAGAAQKGLPVLNIGNNSVCGTAVQFGNQVVLSCHRLCTSYLS